MLHVLFQCTDCGSNVIDLRKPGRFFEHRGVFILLPEHFAIPRCVNPNCLAEWFTDKLMTDLEIILEQEYQVHGDLIHSIVEFHAHKAEK